MRIKRFFLAFVLCLCLEPALEAIPARVSEGTIEIPTYLLGPENPNPPFALGNRSAVYPYSTLDDLTDTRELRAYKAVYLENEYLKAIVLPELGGRLYSLYDKVGKHEVLYRNNVVKYGLVALRGAWISGGIEFNFPNGHTTDTVSRVSCRLLQGADGSATVVVGDVDEVSEMHWEVALTLRPDQARLEQQMTLFNNTSTTKLHWYWANAAVPAADDMQFIYPMRETNPHSHTEIRTYPVWKGVDYSWYRNVRQPTSLFGLQVHRDFFGAYYHRLDRGVVHVADFREVPGKKIWTWGVAGDGQIWTGLLTDQDGPYNEIQAGRFETQLSQEFMPPRQIEEWKEYWYPVAGLGGGFVDATRDLAVNARVVTEGSSAVAEVLAISTVRLAGAHVVLKIGDQVLRDLDHVSFRPLVTREFAAKVPDGAAARQHLRIEITAEDGRPLLRWFAGDPVDGNFDFVPTAGQHKAASLPDVKPGMQELILAAQSDEKEGRQEEAERLYETALARDPRCLPAVLHLAVKALYAADLGAAQDYAARAMATTQTDPQVLYTAAIIQRAAERWSRAEDLLWSSLLYGSAPAPAFAQLGEIAIRRRDYADAQELLRRALHFNPDDALAEADLAAALRLGGDRGGAAKEASVAARLMPLLPFALAEQWRIASSGSETDATSQRAARAWRHTLGYSSQNYLEAGIWYRNLGDFGSSDFVLKSAVQNLAPEQVSPLVYYYLASNARQRKERRLAEDYARKGESAPYGGIFPNRLEDAEVLREAIQQNPKDAHAAYFLGNFLFAHASYHEAARSWSKALAQGFKYSVLLRNLAINAWRVERNLPSAAGWFEQAIQQASDDYRLYVDLDEVYAQLGDTEKRERLFAGAPADVLNRDTVRVRRVLLLVEQRQYDRALETLSGHNFKPWEGGEIVREVYVLANLEKGREALRRKSYSVAENAFRAALLYPANLGVGKPDKPSDEAANYWRGEALSAEGHQDEARQAWILSSQEGGAGGVSLYYHALAMSRLGERDQALQAMETLAAKVSGKSTSLDYYVAALAERFLENEDQARSRLKRALELDPALWQARIELSRPKDQ